jgi:uncharacterized damage-inducible protein DinB
MRVWHAPVLVLLATGALSNEAPAQSGRVMQDLMMDVAQVQQKLAALSKAMPATTWGWRPGEGVRSVGEVVQHVAADNYLIPAFVGASPPAATGIVATDYATVQKYENRKATAAEAVDAMAASFEHLRTAMAATSESQLGEELTVFGQKMTRQQLWVLATTHLHEHLGQMIAYARSNGVVPPWSRGGN